MAERKSYSCTTCGFSTPRWFGRCPDCGAWSSAETRSSRTPAAPATTLATAGQAPAARIATGEPEVDRVFGGGLVRGSAVLVAGEPGVGKSTLLLQIADALAATSRVLYASAEESLEQVSMRARRLGLDGARIHAVATTSVPDIVAAARTTPPDVLIVDSIQTVEDPALDGAAGSVTQVRNCTSELVRLAKETGIVALLVGHVTKDGHVAGPKTLEHLVDAVMSLEGERSGAFRLLRALKNRFGSCEETGVFSMTGEGLEGVADPSASLLEDRLDGAVGSVVFPAIEGTRTLLVEIQALVCRTTAPQPRRVGIGFDQRRLTLLLGVLTSHCGFPPDRDVFLAVTGGMRVDEPAADLAACLALSSALRGEPVDPDVVAVGEVGLSAEIRRVPGIERRLAEAARLGFSRALVPIRSLGSGALPLPCTGVRDLDHALVRRATDAA